MVFRCKACVKAHEPSVGRLLPLDLSLPSATCAILKYSYTQQQNLLPKPFRPYPLWDGTKISKIQGIAAIEFGTQMLSSLLG